MKIHLKRKSTNYNLAEEVHHLAESERSIELELAKEVHALTKEVNRMEQMELIKIFKHPWKFMWFSLLKGIMVGFGSVLGATIFISIFVYVLAQMSFVPVIGDFVKDVMNQIESRGTISTQFTEATNKIQNEQDTQVKQFLQN